MAARLPNQGGILDLGCGHGLFSLALGLSSPSRTILGIDHDTGRVALASKAVLDLPNVQIQLGTIAHPPEGHQPYSGIAMIDVLHYFDFTTQEAVLQKAYDRLKKGGILLVREVDPEGGLASAWNRFYESIATRIGFTQAEKQGLHFRRRKDWEAILEATGFRVITERCSHFLFADILYRCERIQ
jgi:2-polyprenyl-3-methyl-5-hydroxy-6-metoxy-1,4-benzoquinol methylase